MQCIALHMLNLTLLIALSSESSGHQLRAAFHLSNQSTPNAMRRRDSQNIQPNSSFAI